MRPFLPVDRRTPRERAAAMTAEQLGQGSTPKQVLEMVQVFYKFHQAEIVRRQRADARKARAEVRKAVKATPRTR